MLYTTEHVAYNLSKTTNKRKHEMYTDNFEIALRGFDYILDELAKISLKDCGCNCKKNITIDVDDYDNKNSRVCKSNRIGRLNILDDIEQVIFNEPATIVTFKDGTKVCVKACANDTFSKETGLIYAIVKRLYANDIDDNGYLKSKGLGEKISKIVKNGFDQKEQEKAVRAARKAKAAKKAEDAKAKEANEAGENAAKEAIEEIYDKKD